jgi:hypothetical protein
MLKRLKHFLATGFLLPVFTGLSMAQNALPALENITYTNDREQKIITIQFDVSDTESDRVEILFRASFDEGGHFLVNTSNAEGDLGADVNTGAGKSISWYYGDLWDNIEGKTLRLIADDRFRPDLDELVGRVDAGRMQDMLEYISEPRSFQVNTEHLFHLRDSLTALAEHFGYETRLQEFRHKGHTATNVIARKAGLGNERITYIMDAHYDANIDAPGADDNGSGVVGYLEAMRILAPYQFDKTIEFIGFDQEEEGLLGSIAYAWLGGIESWKEVAGVLNYEMIGYYSEEPNTQEVPLGFDLLFGEQYAELEENEFRGDFIFITGNEASADIVEAFQAAAEQYVPGLKVISAVVPLNGLIAPDLLRSDHAPFWFRGIPAVMITDGSEFRNRNYHTLNDIVDSLDFGFMREVTQTGLATLVEMAGLRHADVETFKVTTLVTGTYEDPLSGCTVHVFPNPGSDRIRIETGDCFAGHTPVELIIRDIAGKVLDRTWQDAAAAVMDISSLECGNYFLQLRTGSGSLYRQFAVQQ